MALDRLIAKPITGIHPFNELAIDAAIWQEAHEQHATHRKLHSLCGHRPGILQGLEVFASAKRERTIVVAPGVCIDNDGNTIVNSRPEAFALPDRALYYVTISYNPALDKTSEVKVAGGKDYYRVLEQARIQVVKEPPAEVHVELARINHTRADAAIKNAANPYDPADNEIDLLHRPLGYPHCAVSAGIAELDYTANVDPLATTPNRAGLWHLLREGSGRGFHLQYAGPYNLLSPSRDVPVSLLYMAGHHGFQPLTDDELRGLRDFLGDGGMLFGEACGNSKDFEQSFLDQAKSAGAKLQPVKPGHPLLSAFHVFGDLPPGAVEEGKLLADADTGVVFSSFDYGGAWQGTTAGAGAGQARERVRQAQEFGLNVVAFASARRRQRELSRLE